jgi:hypothetical protein
MKYMSIEDLTRVSVDVVRGTVLAKESHWAEERKGIFTYVDLLIHERAKGSRPVPPVVRIVQPGGELDGSRMLVLGLPDFEVGEEVFVFVAPYSDDPAEADLVSLIGAKLGKFAVLPDPAGGEPQVIRELADVEFAVMEEEEGVSATTLKPARAERRMGINEFRRRVLAAGERPADAGRRARP